MEPSVVTYEKADFIETASGNKVSRKSVLCGSQNIHLNGKSIIKAGAILRGDLALIRIGRFCIIGENAVLRPPYKRFKGGFAFFPLTIGDNVFIESHSVINAASIGSNVMIGAGCVISKRCILKDNCRILPGTVLAPDTVVPPFAVFGGCPGRYIGELPESVAEMHRAHSSSYYKRFQPHVLPTPTTTSSSV
eukprot:GILK01008281.1.p1 GENE.GILK01008281.1~~GILK01008281.1.p1  ORF type:complete len:192 (+),score=2.78 GILK01008281.1:42-617(+)